MYAVGISLTILGLIVLVLLLLEIRSFQAGRTLITRRRLVLRVVAGLLLLALLVAVFVGIFMLRLTTAEQRPQLFLVYWTSCLLVAIVLVWVMLADIQEVESRYSERRQQIWRDMSEFVGHELAGREKRDSVSGGDSDE